jgi:8-oxo-dGTP diphosphatase
MTVVVAAIIERDGKVLACQRHENGAHPLKWEFPGGKVEPGETPVQALQRELEEELEIEAQIGPEITRYEYAYAGKAPILLIFYQVTQFRYEPQNRVFHAMRWETKSHLPDYDFLEGDVNFVRRLATGC